MEQVLPALALLASQPDKKQPFVMSELYPHFAGFAAYYGAGQESKSWATVFKLCEGKHLKDLVPLNDRVFLFFVFVNLCGKQELQDGWYFCERASTMMKNIRRWMTKEDKMEAENEKAKQKTIKHFLDLADTLEEMVASEPADGSDGAAESDGMESD
jgi:hypothetical protein